MPNECIHFTAAVFPFIAAATLLLHQFYCNLDLPEGVVIVMVVIVVVMVMVMVMVMAGVQMQFIKGFKFQIYSSGFRR